VNADFTAGLRWSPSATTASDPTGKYFLCPAFVFGSLDGAVLQVPVETRGDTTVFDVDLTPLVIGCPGRVIPRPS